MTAAAVMTYDSLVEDVLSYLERTDEATRAKIPTFIMLAESKISNEVKILGQIQVVSSNMEIGNPVINKPARWRETVSMNVTVAGKRYPVLSREYEYIRNYWPTATETSVPKYYADYDYDHWFVGPTPDDDYAFEVLYYERLQPLSSANQTNWLTINAPQVMLYGTLLESMPFLKNDDRLQLWQAVYDRALGALKKEDDKRSVDRQSVVVER